MAAGMTRSNATKRRAKGPSSAAAPGKVGTFAWRLDWSRFVAPASVLALACIVFWPVVRFDLLDYGDRPRLQRPFFREFTTQTFGRLWWPAYHRAYRPLADSVLWFEAAIARETAANSKPATKAQRPRAPQHVPLDPAVLHFGNLVLHAATTLVVFALLGRIGFSSVAAAIGAVVFAVHPLQIEAVAWVSAAGIPMATLLGLLAILVYFERVGPLKQAAATSPQGATARWAEGLVRSWHYPVATLLFVAALLSDPIALAVPIVAWVWAVAYRSLRWQQAAWSVALWCLLGGATMLLVADTGPIAAARQLPLWMRPLVATDALMFYVGKLIVPWQLTADYGRGPLQAAQTWWFHVAWIGPLALLAVVWLFRIGARTWAPAATFAGALLPSLGLVAFGQQDVSTVADRLAYLAMLGAAVGFAEIVSRVRWPTGRVAIALGLVVSCAWLTTEQLGRWRDDAALLQHDLRTQPDSFPLRTVAAKRLAASGHAEEALRALQESAARNPQRPQPQVILGDALREAQQWAEAEKAYRAALEAAPEWPDAYDGLGQLLLAQGKAEQASAYFRDCLRGDPYNSAAWRHLAESLREQGRWDEAADAYHLALRRAPYDALSQSGLGLIDLARGNLENAARWCRRAVATNGSNAVVHERLAQVLRAQGMPGEALREALRAAELDPQRLSARLLAGELLFEQGDRERAESHFRAVLKIEPFHALAYYWLGRILHESGQTEQAIAYYRAATRIDQRLVVAHAGLAAALADSEQWGEAIRYYNSAVMLAPKDAGLRNNLGYVLTRVGALKEAMACFEIALKLAPQFAKARQNLEAVRRELARREAAAQPPKAAPTAADRSSSANE